MKALVGKGAFVLGSVAFILLSLAFVPNFVYAWLDDARRNYGQTSDHAPAFAIGGAIVATLIAVGLARAARRATRSATGSEIDQYRKAILFLVLTGTLSLAAIGSALSRAVDTDLTRVPRLRPDGLPPSLRYVAGALISLSLIALFAALVLLPSTSRELSRRIDLEASAVTLGVILFFAFLYSGFQSAFGLPSFSSGIVIVAILVVYLLARLVLQIRYR